MAISCEPDELVAISTCYTCIQGLNIDAVKIYLLAVTAGLQDQTPEELVAASKCYSCIPKDMQKSVANYLLCQIAGGVSENCEQVLSYVTDPTVEGVVPVNQNLPAIVYQEDGLDATYTWNTTTHVWQ